MPNIKTYTAPIENLTESPRGSAAWTQAGRRLGPLYNEAAQFAREAGKLAANNKAELWPFSILELYQKNAAAEAAASSKKAGGVKIAGGPTFPNMGQDAAAQNP